MDQSHFNSSARSRMCTDSHTHTHTQSKSEVDFTLTSLTFHPEHPLKEKHSKRLQGRTRLGREAKKDTEKTKKRGWKEKEWRETEKKKVIKEKKKAYLAAKAVCRKLISLRKSISRSGLEPFYFDYTKNLCNLCQFQLQEFSCFFSVMWIQRALITAQGGRHWGLDACGLWSPAVWGLI